MLAHLLKYDTAQGRYDGHVVESDDEANTITVDGKVLKIYAEKDAANCPWGELGVDVVLECTGFYCSTEKSMAHINAGENFLAKTKKLSGAVKFVRTFCTHTIWLKTTAPALKRPTPRVCLRGIFSHLLTSF